MECKENLAIDCNYNIFSKTFYFKHSLVRITIPKTDSAVCSVSFVLNLLQIN